MLWGKLGRAEKTKEKDLNIVDKSTRYLIIDFTPISPRMSCLRIKGKFFNISLINAHAPTENKEDKHKDQFYDELECVYDRCPRNDIKIIIGDLNAKIGKEEIYYKPYIGTFSAHDNTWLEHEKPTPPPPRKIIMSEPVGNRPRSRPSCGGKKLWTKML